MAVYYGCNSEDLLYNKLLRERERERADFGSIVALWTDSLSQVRQISHKKIHKHTHTSFDMLYKSLCTSQLNKVLEQGVQNIYFFRYFRGSFNKRKPDI